MAKDSELARLRSELADVQNARRVVLRNGAAYKIAGSHDVQMPELSALAREEKRIRARILSLLQPGRTAKTWARF